MLLRVSTRICAGPRDGTEASESARAARAVRLVQLAKFRRPRALTAAPLAPGTADMLAEPRDPDRSALVRGSADTLPRYGMHSSRCDLLLACLRAARGSAAGPFGATNLQLLLDDPHDSLLLHCAAERFANAAQGAQILSTCRVETGSGRRHGAGLEAGMVGPGN